MCARSRPQVVADVHERQSGIPQALEDLAVEVTIAPLRAGDYAIGSDVLIERKSVLDLHGSIEQRRFWPQIGKLRYESRFPFLLAERENIDAGSVVSQGNPWSLYCGHPSRDPPTKNDGSVGLRALARAARGAGGESQAN